MWNQKDGGTAIIMLRKLIGWGALLRKDRSKNTKVLREKTVNISDGGNLQRGKSKQKKKKEQKIQKYAKVKIVLKKDDK